MKEQAENEYWAVFDEWKRLSENKKKYAPKTPEEEPHPLFVEALQNSSWTVHISQLDSLIESILLDSVSSILKLFLNILNIQLFLGR